MLIYGLFCDYMVVRLTLTASRSGDLKIYMNQNSYFLNGMGEVFNSFKKVSFFAVLYLA